MTTTTTNQKDSSASTTINSSSSPSTDENTSSFINSVGRRATSANSAAAKTQQLLLLRSAKRSPPSPTVISTLNSSTLGETIAMPNGDHDDDAPPPIDHSSTTTTTASSLAIKPHQPKKKMKNGHHTSHHTHHHFHHRQQHLLQPSSAVALRRTNSMTDEEFEEFVEEEEEEEIVECQRSAIKIAEEEEEEEDEDKDSVVETTTSEDEEEFEQKGQLQSNSSNHSKMRRLPPLCYNGRHCLDCESSNRANSGGFLIDEDNTSDLTSSPPPPISSPSASSSITSSADSSPSSSSLNPLQTLTKIQSQQQQKSQPSMPNSTNSTNSQIAKSLENVLIDAVIEASKKSKTSVLPPPPPPPLPEASERTSELGLLSGSSAEDDLCCPLCCPDPEVRLETGSSPLTSSSSPPSQSQSSHLLPYYPPTVSSIREAVSHLTRLDDFNVVKLSHGFFSQVFKVVHFSTKKVMVLKMNKEAGNRGNALKEIELLNKLNHENIVAYMGTVVHEGALHPLLEFINGGTLEQLIRPFYTCSEEMNAASPPEFSSPQSSFCYHHHHQASATASSSSSSSSLIISPKVHRLRDPDWTFLKLMRDVAAGMEYLHACGYLHRDLASKNVFIRKRAPHQAELDGSMIIRRSSTEDYDWFDDQRLVAVIGDFGFATTEPTADTKLSTVGSPYWLAPECFKNQWYNHRCDIYSFGVVCCELNWRVPADPDFLPRLEHNFAVDFGKLDCRGVRGAGALGKVAMRACSIDPAARPEFSAILDAFDFELNKRHNGMKTSDEEEVDELKELSLGQLDSQMVNLVEGEEEEDFVDGSGNGRKCGSSTPAFKRGFSLDSSMLQSVQLQQEKEVSRPLKSVDESDIFEQHLLRRRYSSALAKAAAGAASSSPDHHHRVSPPVNCHHNSPFHSHHHHHLYHPHHHHLHRNFSSPLPDVRNSRTREEGGGNEVEGTRRNL